MVVSPHWPLLPIQMQARVGAQGQTHRRVPAAPTAAAHQQADGGEELLELGMGPHLLPHGVALRGVGAGAGAVPAGW